MSLFGRRLFLFLSHCSIHFELVCDLVCMCALQSKAEADAAGVCVCVCMFIPVYI